MGGPDAARLHLPVQERTDRHPGLAWRFYAAAFVPLTYWVDRTAYRTYLRRLERAAGVKKT